MPMSSATTNNINNITNNNDESPPTTIRWGIIGLGDVCQKKAGPAFYKCHGSQLAAVMRRTPGKAAAWANANVPQDNHCVGYDNLDAFLQHEPPLHAVYIATRPGTHLDICRQVVASASASKKSNTNNNNNDGILQAIYVEKPVGRCAAETIEMAQLCQTAGVSFYTAYISRAYERTKVIRQLLRQDRAIGDYVTNVTYKLVGMGGARGMDATTTKELPWRLDAKQSGGGLIMDVGCHVLDRLDYLCGPLINVVGTAERRASHSQETTGQQCPVVEDYVHLNAQIGEEKAPWAAIPSAGASVSCTWDFSGTSTQEEIDELVIAGPKGSLRMAGMSAAGPIQVLDSQGTVVGELNHFTMPEHTAQGHIQAVTDELRGRHSMDDDSGGMISRGDNAIRTSQVLDTALSSYYGGREIGYWGRPESWPGCSSVT